MMDTKARIQGLNLIAHGFAHSIDLLRESMIKPRSAKQPRGLPENENHKVKEFLQKISTTGQSWGSKL